jgi:hypothetical protein
MNENKKGGRIRLIEIDQLLKLVVEKVQSGMMPATVDEKRRYLHWDKIN